MWLSPWHLRDVLKSLHVWRFAGAAFALLLSWPAAAQPVTFCDTNFLAANWTLTIFSGPAGNTVSATPETTGGSISTTLPNPQPPAACPLNGDYRDVADILNIAGTTSAESGVYGVHIFYGIYNPANSGAIGSINFQIDYECPDSATSASCPNTDGQAFGPALVQNGHYFVANTAGTATNVKPWNRFFTGSPLLATAFNEITTTGTGANAVVKIDSTAHPDFSGTAPPIQCGFYTGNSTFGAGYTNHAGYDNWVCTITPMGYLKVCKVAGPGVAVGTSFTFTSGSSKFTVPAGPPPGGTCAIGPSLPVGTNATVIETIPSGDAVSSITVAPPGQLVSTNLATGTATVTIGSGVTEVTYTDYSTMGYLEICKQGDLDTKGNFTFTVNPGNLGPFSVPPGYCSPAIQVTAGQVVITEAPTAGIVMSGCATVPASQQGACNLPNQTSTVTVAPGDVSAETIAIIRNTRGQR